MPRKVRINRKQAQAMGLDRKRSSPTFGSNAPKGDREVPLGHANSGGAAPSVPPLTEPLPAFGVGNHPGAATHTLNSPEPCARCGTWVHRLVSSMEPHEPRPRVCETCWKERKRR